MLFRPIKFSILALLIISCNPECDQTLSASFDSATKQAGQELLIKSNNPEFVLSRGISFISSEGTTVSNDARFSDELQGIVATIPDNMTGDDIRILIDDPDCGPQIIGSQLSVFDPSFFINNPNFIPPAPFEIVIPTPPIAFPPIVKNAWVSPQDLDYCVWLQFLPERDEDGKIIMVDINGEMSPKESIYIDDAISFEYSVDQLVCMSTESRLYHDNPVSGIVDKDNNIVNFWIDRTDVNGQNLGIEEFEGSFINISEAGYKENKLPQCSPSGVFNPEKNYLMLVTSMSTGRQLLLYQQAFL